MSVDNPLCYIVWRNNGERLLSGFLLIKEWSDYEIYDMNYRSRLSFLPVEYAKHISYRQFLILLKVKVDDRLSIMKSDQFIFLSNLGNYDIVWFRDANNQWIQGKFIGFQDGNDAIIFHQNRQGRNTKSLVPIWNIHEKKTTSSELPEGSATYSQTVVHQQPQKTAHPQVLDPPKFFIVSSNSSLNYKPFVSVRANNDDVIIDWTLKDKTVMFTTEKHPAVDVADMHIFQNGKQLSPEEINTMAEQFLTLQAKKQSEKDQRGSSFVFKDIPQNIHPLLSKCVLGTPISWENTRSYVCWIGCHGDDYCVVVEQEWTNQNHPRNDGLFEGQRLCHATPGYSCVLIYDISSIRLIMKKQVLPENSESCQLVSSHLPNHLGCEVKVKDKTGVGHFAHLLWTGRIKNEEAVLVQLDYYVQHYLFNQLSKEPWLYYWWDKDDYPILLMHPESLEWPGECGKINNQSFAAPHGYFPLDNQRLSVPLGISVLVQLQNKQVFHHAHLVWIGTGGCQSIAGVEVDEQTNEIQTDKPKFWIPITGKMPVCVPKKQIFLTTESIKDKWPDNVTYDERITKIGTHVNVGQTNDVLACVLWAGWFNTQRIVIVKLVDDLNKNFEYNELNPQIFCQHEHVPGFYGPTIVVNKSNIRPLSQNLFIPTDQHVIADHPCIGEQFQFSIRRDNSSHFFKAKVALALKINNQIYFAVVASSSITQKSDYPLFRAFAAHKLISEKKITSSEKVCLISEQNMKPDPEEKDLPSSIKPWGLQIKNTMSFWLDEKVFEGKVKWTGKWKGKWLVGLEVHEKLTCPNLHADLQLKNAIPYCSPDCSLVFMEPSRVFMHVYDVPYAKWFFEKLRDCVNDGDLRMNYHVEISVTHSDWPNGVRGVCRYIGQHEVSNERFVGVELYESQIKRHVATNGTFPDENGVKLFECPTACGIVVPRAWIKVSNYSITPDSRSNYCNVPHDAKFIRKLVLPEQTLSEELGFGLGSAVEVDLQSVCNKNSLKQTGKCVYVGIHKESKQCYVGVELDSEINCLAVTDGMFPRSEGVRLFHCSDHKGVLLPKEHVQFNPWCQQQQNVQSKSQVNVKDQQSSHSSNDNKEEKPVEENSSNSLNSLNNLEEIKEQLFLQIKTADNQGNVPPASKEDKESKNSHSNHTIIQIDDVDETQSQNANDSQQNPSHSKSNTSESVFNTENKGNNVLSTATWPNSPQESQTPTQSSSLSVISSSLLPEKVQKDFITNIVTNKNNSSLGVNLVFSEVSPGVKTKTNDKKCEWTSSADQGEKPAPEDSTSQSGNKITETDSKNDPETQNIPQNEKVTSPSPCINEPLSLSECLSSRNLYFGCASNATLVPLGSLIRLSDYSQVVVCWFGLDEQQESYVGVEVEGESPNLNDVTCTQKWKSITKNRSQLMFMKDVQGLESSSMSSQSYLVKDCGFIIGSHVQVHHESMEFTGCLLWTGVDRFTDKDNWAAVKLRNDHSMQEYKNPFDETFVCSHKYVPGFTGRVVIVSVDKLSTSNQEFTLGVTQFHCPSLGTNVWVKNARRTLCWIGRDEHDQVLVGVEQDQNKATKEDDNTNYPWLSITQGPRELVSLTEDVKLDAPSMHLRDYQLEDRGFVIGSHVQVKLNNKFSFLGCLLWTGSVKTKKGGKRFCVVVKAADDSVSTRLANVHDGRNVCLHRDVPGFYGPVLLLSEEMISAFDQNFIIPSDQNVLPEPPSGQEEVFIKDERGEIRLPIQIDGELYYLVVVMNKPQPPAEAPPLFKEFAARKIKLQRNEHLWFVHHKDVEFVISEQKDLPPDLRPPLFKMNEKFMAKVEGKDYLGLVKWTGTIDRKWFVGLKVKKKKFLSCPIVRRYPQLKQKLRYSSGTWPVFVEAELVRPVTEMDLIKVVFGVPQTEKFFESVDDDFEERGLAVGWYVQVSLNKDNRQVVEGICRWLGRQRNTNNRYVGIELNSAVKGGTNGMFPKYNGKQLFSCPSKCGIVVSRAQVTVPNLLIVSERYGVQKPGVKIYCEVPHDIAFIKLLTSQERPPETWKFGLGYAVEVNLTDNSYRPKGVCTYIGQHRDTKQYFIGVELDNEIYSNGATNGTFPRQNGIKLFQCDDHKGVLLPWKRVQLDSRLVQAQLEMEQKMAALDIKHKQKEIKWENDSSQLIVTVNYINKFLGDNGIQGKLNSCYMDATLFAMFAFNDTFDSILHLDNSIVSDEQHPLKLLKHAIVNVMRRHAYVPQVNMKKFRLKFESMTGSKGMTKDQKDPEEFLSFLFEKLCKTPSFLRYADGDNAHLLQLFFECENLPPVLSVHHMIKASFEMMNAEFSEAPVNLILQIPREGGSYVGFKMVALDLNLDLHKWISQDSLSDFECFACKKSPAMSFCSACYKIYCDQCSRNLLACKHNQQKKKNIFEMELQAVLCIEVSHYVTFVRIREQTKEEKYRWIFFDSMGKREGDINLPVCEDMGKARDKLDDDWILSFAKNKSVPRNLPSQQQRLVSNAYTLFYRNPRLSVYD